LAAISGFVNFTPVNNEIYPQG